MPQLRQARINLASTQSFPHPPLQSTLNGKKKSKNWRHRSKPKLNRDARHEEMLAKFELLMRAYTNNHQQDPSDRHDPSATAMEHGTGDTSTPTTPDRLPPMGQPPPKRPNTNSSPHRHIYSIFRQQSVKSNSPKTRKTNNLLLTQPMDTDDDYRQPVLRAKSSKKLE